jgi:hypothetical protein
MLGLGGRGGEADRKEVGEEERGGEGRGGGEESVIILVLP